MGTQPFSPNPKLILLPFLVVLALLLACARVAGPPSAPLNVSGLSKTTPSYLQVTSPTQEPFVPVQREPGTPIQSPTPDAPHALPTLRTDPEEYVVQHNDTLNQIAKNYGVSLEQLIDANQLANPNLLEIGQILTIPAPMPDRQGPSFKVIPDSELVYGPASVGFDIEGFTLSKGGYLARYQEEVDDRELSGPAIVERVAGEYSVNPRLLLAVLEYQSGWVTRQEPLESTLDYPIGVYETWREGLYMQLAYAANNLNLGYYLWRVNWIGTWITNDAKIIPIDPTINAGTAAVQHLFSKLYDRDNWEIAVSEQGLYTTYYAFFGHPFDLAMEPLIPPGLMQPAMQLPFEEGRTWSFTGGPHGGWGSGSGWAALDFAPPGEALGCVLSDDWVVAVADGLIVRSDLGAVVQDLDGDGHEQTGWAVLYMHIESRDRVQAGAYLNAGDRIGHASCEGGVSNGTHLHLARRYNGEWIPADQTLPFVLDRWVSRGSGREYDGFMEREGHTIEAWEGRFPKNAIER